MQQESGLERLDVLTPELVTLRDARRRAFEARVAAEHALRQAEEAEAKLLIREASAQEAAAVERVALLEAQFHQASRAKEEAQSAAMAIAQSCNEARTVLEQLIASLAEGEERVTLAATQARQVEALLAASRQRAREATQIRERAEAGVPPAPVAPAEPVAAAEPLALDPAIFANSSMAAERAAQRRAADAERTKTGE